MATTDQGDDVHDGVTPADPQEPFVAMTETHTAAVFFVGASAFKLKKPVRYGFLDFTTLESRRRICHREVELNRRLAPDVYLGVAELRSSGGDVLDYLVSMRRLPAGRALSRLVVEGRDLRAILPVVAATLARFHEQAERSPRCDRSASAATTLERWRSTAAEMAPLIGTVLEPNVCARALHLASRYVEGRGRLFAERISAGRACDGHGDLLADDVFWLDDGPRVLDCLEFDDDLRSGDVLGDVCSLAMDLERLGGRELGVAFVTAYQEASGDHWPASLAHHYLAYRAQVRALVAGLRSDQGDRDAGELGRELLRLCNRHLEAGRVRLIVIGGLPGSGKTTVAGWAAEALGASVIRSDVVRKTLAGLDPFTPAPAPFRHGLYQPELTTATYRELMDRARAELTMGRSVILDATFSDPTWRAEARQVAADTVSDLDEVRCVASPEVVRARLNARLATGRDASDADPAVAERMAEEHQEWPEALVLDCDSSTDIVRQRLFDIVGFPAAS